MSGHVSAASEDLAAQSKGKPVDIHSQSKREPDAEKREPDAGEGEPMAESNKSEIEPDLDIPSERKPFPEIAFKSERKVTWGMFDAENGRSLDVRSEDGTSLNGSSSQRSSDRKSERKSDASAWISEEEWLDWIKDDPHVPARSLSDVSIFKIPDFLKDTGREAYVPRRVLLGPYHNGRKKVRAVDINKKRALRGMKTKLYKETDSQNDFYFIKSVLDAIRNNEVEIRDSYEESIDCDGKSLAMMLSVDGCFVLEVLKNLHEHEVNNHKAFASNALKDILMLENQIPWIVLLELLRLETPKEEDDVKKTPKEDDVKKTLLNLMVNGTSCLFEMSEEDRTALLQWIQPATTKVLHLLDFVHNVIVYWPPSPSNPGNQGEHRISIERCIGRCLQMPQGKSKAPNQGFKTIPPAVELKNAGIKFKLCSGGIEQISFDPDSSTIYLPLLSITSYTEVLFRNLMAFEMCRQSKDNYVCGYVNLMDDLIDSQNDVAFLRSKGILTNQLGSDKEVADLFNGLFKGVNVRMPNNFEVLRAGVNKNYKNKTRVRLEELWRDHFSSPWKTIALLVGFAILCLNLIQTVSTVIQTIHSKK